MGLLDRLKSAAAAKPTGMPGSTGVSHEFAFLDVETTGVDARVDRIIEVGIVITDAQGNVLEEFCTLVRPEGDFNRDKSAQRVHLIDYEWLKAAPSTSAVLVEIAHRLHGRIVVAHNAMFDCDFVQQELKRCLGYSDRDLGDWTTLCTVDLCRQVDIPRKLDRACFELGIRYEKHSALGDCHATAQLLHQFMRRIDPRTFAGLTPTTFGRLPEGPPTQPVLRSEGHAATTARPVLADLVAGLPPHDATADRDPAVTDAYLTALEDAIADGYISPDEVAALSATASRFGLSAGELQDLHQEVVLGLIDTALDDRKISPAERRDIENAAAWLGVDVSDWDAFVKAARARIKAEVDSFRAEVKGRTIAFAGTGIHKPNIREAFAAKHGFAYATQVGPATDLLVIGTDQTATEQVRRAQESGVPILVEATFWRRLGEV